MTTHPETAADSMSEQGFEHLRQGAFESAVESFSAGLALSPNNAKALAGRGLSEFFLRDLKKASEDFLRARMLEPNDPEHGLNLGMSLALDEKIYEAISVYEDVLSTHPNLVRAHIQLGQLYFKLCAIARGRRHMEAALASRPTLAERRLIESLLKEQNTLDRGRYYRPDFEALNQNKGQTLPQSPLARLARVLMRFTKKGGAPK